MKILLQHKIFIGYFLLMAIIGSMVAIVLHERSRVQKIENESIAIFQTQHNINTTHRYVTTLVTYGESVRITPHSCRARRASARYSRWRSSPFPTTNASWWNSTRRTGGVTSLS